MHKLDQIIKIKHVITYGPLCKPLLSLNASDEEKQIFSKNKLFAEISVKFHFFYPSSQIECLSLKNKKYVYYIPSDIYRYIKYDGDHVIVNKEIPNELKTKIENCAKYLELELNYLNHIINVNFERDDFFIFKCRKKLFKPILIINYSTDKISFNTTYEQIIDNEYIKDYKKLLEEEKMMIESGRYIT